MFLTVKIIPQAQNHKVVGFYNNMLKIQLQGAPEKGKLNLELVDFLSKEMDVPKMAICLKQGFTQPVKRLHIDDQYALKVQLYIARYQPRDVGGFLDED